ncbi:response regulator [Azonexus hydrophilus]|uniref:histidine kinase n=1 Tax=Azonexus hydrophilus TaxID=418702 RepID=A0ABZ2XLZ7_9RHOO
MRFNSLPLASVKRCAKDNLCKWTPIATLLIKESPVETVQGELGEIMDALRSFGINAVAEAVAIISRQRLVTPSMRPLVEAISFELGRLGAGEIEATQYIEELARAIDPALKPGTFFMPVIPLLGSRSASLEPRLRAAATSFRPAFQSSMLTATKAKSVAKWRTCRDAIIKIENRNSPARAASAISIAASFLDIVASNAVEPDKDLLQILSRIDFMLRDFSKGVASIDLGLLSRMLYYIAKAPPVTRRIALTQERYDLPNLQSSAAPDFAVATQWLKTKSLFAQIEDCWESVAENDGVSPDLLTLLSNAASTAAFIPNASRAITLLLRIINAPRDKLPRSPHLLSYLGSTVIVFLDAIETRNTQYAAECFAKESLHLEQTLMLNELADTCRDLNFGERESVLFAAMEAFALAAKEDSAQSTVLVQSAIDALKLAQYDWISSIAERVLSHSHASPMKNHLSEAYELLAALCEVPEHEPQLIKTLAQYIEELSMSSSPTNDTDPIAKVDDTEVFSIFEEEAKQIVSDAIELCIEALGAGVGTHHQATELCRLFHTAKGSAAIVGLTPIATAIGHTERTFRGWLAIGAASFPCELMEFGRESARQLNNWVMRLAAAGECTIPVSSFEVSMEALLALRDMAPTIAALGDKPEMAGPLKNCPPDVVHAFKTEPLDFIAIMKTATDRLMIDGITPELIRAAHALSGIGRTTALSWLRDTAHNIEEWAEQSLSKNRAISTQHKTSLEDACAMMESYISKCIAGDNTILSWTTALPFSNTDANNDLFTPLPEEATSRLRNVDIDLSDDAPDFTESRCELLALSQETDMPADPGSAIYSPTSSIHGSMLWSSEERFDPSLTQFINVRPFKGEVFLDPTEPLGDDYVAPTPTKANEREAPAARVNEDPLFSASRCEQLVLAVNNDMPAAQDGDTDNFDTSATMFWGNLHAASDTAHFDPTVTLLTDSLSFRNEAILDPLLSENAPPSTAGYSFAGDSENINSLAAEAPDEYDPTLTVFVDMHPFKEEVFLEPLDLTQAPQPIPSKKSDNDHFITTIINPLDASNDPVAAKPPLVFPATPAPEPHISELTPSVDPIDREILSIFLAEAEELFEELQNEIESFGPGQSFTKINRILHTLKGGVRMTGAIDIGEELHYLEDLTQHVDINDSKKILDQVRRGADEARLAINALATHDTTRSTDVPTADTMIAAEGDTAVRIHGSQLAHINDLMLALRGTRNNVDELIGSIGGSIENARDPLERIVQLADKIKIEAETRIESGCTNHAPQFDALEMDRFGHLHELTRRLTEATSDIYDAVSTLDRTLQTLTDSQDKEKSMFSTLGERIASFTQTSPENILPRLRATMRLACDESGKLAKMQYSASDIRIGRAILDKAVPAIEHILRNAIAHGIESPEERRAEGKNETGVITFSVRREGQFVDLNLSDDGRGLHLPSIRAKAIARGIISNNDSDEDAIQAIFHPGFSTAESIDRLAGRGVGLDVVATIASELGGRVSVTSQTGQGAQFSLRLPIDAHTISGILMESGDAAYIVPATNISAMHTLSRSEIERALLGERLGEAYGNTAVYWIGSLPYQQPAKLELASHNPICQIANSRIALFAERSTYISQLRMRPLADIGGMSLPGIIGYSLLPNGRVALVIAPNNLLADRNEAVRPPSMLAKSQCKPNVLVVDDSLTVRKVTRSLLERNGFEVQTAENGIVAFNMLQQTRPDIILMDIEMPVMDGYEATRSIKSTEAFKDIPIIIVSSRHGQKHIDFARSLGACDFVGKPYQDKQLLALISAHLATKEARAA